MNQVGLKPVILRFQRQRSWAAAVAMLMVSCNQSSGGGGPDAGSSQGGGGSEEGGGGTAGAGCGAGQSECADACVDTQSDPAHCGGCDAACTPGLACRGGACTCVLGEYQDLGSATPQTVTGTTAGGGADYDLSCLGVGSTEQTFSFTAPANGTFSFVPVGSGFNAAIGVLRADDCSELACAAGPTLAPGATVVLRAGETVLLVISGENGAAGAFSLGIAQITLPSCATIDLGSTVPQTVTGDTTGLPDLYTSACGGDFAGEASFGFTAPEDGNYIFDTAGSSFDTVVYVLDAACSTPELACNDDGAYPGRTVAALTAGQTVAVFVDGALDISAGSFSLAVSRHDGAGFCVDPIDLGSAVPNYAGGTTNGLVNSLPSCGYEDIAPEAVHAFTAPADGIYIFDTLNSTASTTLSIFDGGCSGPLLTCNDDYDYAVPYSQSRASVTLAAGQTVYVAVEASGSGGEYNLDIAQYTGLGTCATPIDLGSTVPQGVSGSTFAQLDQVYTYCSDSISHAPETVYTFTAPHDGTFAFSAIGFSFQPVIHLHDGACSGAMIGCDGVGFLTQVQALLSAGQTVTLVVDGSGGQLGNYSLSIFEQVVVCPTPGPSNGTCSAPIELGSTVPQAFSGSTTCRANSAVRGCQGTYGADAVHRFTAPTSGFYVFHAGTLASSPGSLFSAAVNVYGGGCAGPLLGCGPYLNSLPFEYNPPEVMLSLDAGQEVYVVIEGEGNSSGDYSLSISQF